MAEAIQKNKSIQSCKSCQQDEELRQNEQDYQDGHFEMPEARLESPIASGEVRFSFTAKQLILCPQASGMRAER